MFGRQRDVSLFRHINRELLWDIVTQQIGYYKYKLEATRTNIYGEALEKFFIDPVLLNCLQTSEDQQWGGGGLGDDFGPDETRNIKFAFLRDDLVDADVVCEVGDVIVMRDVYFEVDSVIQNEMFVGKNPSYAYSQGLHKFGWSNSIICMTHNVPADKYGITKERL